MWSATFTGDAGLVVLPLIFTCPPRHAVAASARVFVSRTAWSHWSIRTLSIGAVCPSGDQAAVSGKNVTSDCAVSRARWALPSTV